ncbi:patatin-like phospholipase family protein [Mycobacterium sp. ITM-2016-00318]|uniref:patatin-like phospholipase family protein n=1 Tax=Mycobacterium sp. ITM-2016-00318 TaxID=2099693 RepID=UPI00287FC7C2|nr:patatin-like phospholipase family protein [Mycobacterium sp. ITM-2016-00318]WNG93551.1 patatin-like phospholipase family protein [Mycobacterium sp. ITM-2016-00318]
MHRARARRRGVLGAAEAGMARTLLEAGIRPDLVCGTSVGAINGAVVAADPTPGGARRLLAIWDALAQEGSLAGRSSGGPPKSCAAGRHYTAIANFAGCCVTDCPRKLSSSRCRSSASRPASKVPKGTGSAQET